MDQMLPVAFRTARLDDLPAILALIAQDTISEPTERDHSSGEYVRAFEVIADHPDHEIVVALADGRRVSAPLEWFPRLLRATPAQRSNWSLIGRGVGIHWPDVDEDISVRSLLAV